jgi:ferredoxin
MNKSKRNSGFREDLCNLCGICLHKCPVLKLPLDEAMEKTLNMSSIDALHVFLVISIVLKKQIHIN